MDDLYWKVSALKDKADEVASELDELAGALSQLDDDALPDPDTAAEAKELLNSAAINALSAMSDLFHIVHVLRDRGADIEIAPFEDDVLITHLANAKLIHDDMMKEIKWAFEVMERIKTKTPTEG